MPMTGLRLDVSSEPDWEAAMARDLALGYGLATTDMGCSREIESTAVLDPTTSLNDDCRCSSYSECRPRRA